MSGPRATTLIELETPRLLLRQWRASDRAPFAAMGADQRVMQYFPALLDRVQSDAMADRCEALIAEKGWGLWAVECRASGAFIGFVGLHEPAAALPFAPCVEIGWRLAASHWGQGLAMEAAAAALQAGFQELALAEIVAFTSVPNRRSQAVMQRLGMRQDGFFAHPLLAADHLLSRHVLYRLDSAVFRASSRSMTPVLRRQASSPSFS
ncbi:N-acetyltransferase [Corticibacter populi]|uniref:N-acetyltransferase n=1 Tax=Corticibacter populi TaxID=1550736 RepID=A0A3M6QP05_9BURK|nr:GNAT family N-acetyltransferase [Corticibacter populi]RMX04784.1 N-acetyltransferase [Corticibacter populi]RZS33804.1 RimJ/RimL family protein N-acetyltransferase [Corticibacter populi]